MNPVFVVLLFIAIFATALTLGARQSKRAGENIRQLAATLGLRLVSKPPTWGLFYSKAQAEGELRGKSVMLYPFTTGSGKSQVQWCAVSAMVPADNPLAFYLRRQGFNTKVMELFGAKEIQVGDGEFDRTWFIQTNEPDFFREALLPELRAKITALGTSARRMEFKLEKNVVRYVEIGTFADPVRCQRCERAMDIVCDLADVAEVFAEQHKAK